MTLNASVVRPLIFVACAAVCALTILACCCGGGGGGGGSWDTTDLTTDSGSDSKKVHALGEVVTIKKHRVAMHEAKFTEQGMVAGFTMANDGTESIEVSTIIGWEARNSDGTTLDQDFFACDTGLGGTLMPGELLKGNVCWDGAKPGLKITYTPDLFGDKVVWEIAEAGTADPGITANASAAPASKAVGEAVILNDQNITLNSATIKSKKLTANFLIVNTGSTDISVSGMMGFEARTPDGTTLEQDFFNCKSDLSGTVMPGDKLKGNICWTNAVEGTKIYYTPSLFGGTTITWVVP